jgi:hypothetical protein
LLVVFKNDYSAYDYQAIENIINELKANSAYQHIDKLIVWGGRKTASSYCGFQVLHPILFLWSFQESECPSPLQQARCTEMFLMTGHEVILTIAP